MKPTKTDTKITDPQYVIRRLEDHVNRLEWNGYWQDTAGNLGHEEPQGTIVKGQPTKHDFATCVVADCHECNKEATELLDIAEYFRKRGMVQNADLVQSAVMRLNLYSGTKLIAQVMGSKGGKKSKRILTPEQAKAMVKVREKNKLEKR